MSDGLGTHSLNLPWRICDEMPGRVVDSKGIPVAWGSTTTSIKSKAPGETIYRTTETAGPVRARVIVDAVNRFYGVSQ